MPFHIYLCISFSMKENEEEKGKLKRNPIVEQQTDLTRTASERALDKEPLQEPSDAKQIVKSAFTCPLLKSQM